MNRESHGPVACSAEYGTMTDKIPNLFGRELHFSSSAFRRLHFHIQFAKAKAVRNITALQLKNHRLSLSDSGALRFEGKSLRDNVNALRSLRDLHPHSEKWARRK